MNPAEIQQLKDKAAQTPQRTRLRLQTQEDPKATARILVILNKGSIQGGEFNTPRMNDTEWGRYKTIWEKYMDQIMIYCVINQNNYTQEGMETIQDGVFKYMAWNTIDIWDTVDTRLPQTIQKSMPAPHYNPAKGIPWLVKEWANIEQYLQIEEIKEAIVDETAMSMTTEEIQEIQEIADLQREIEGTSEKKEDDVIIT